MKIYFGNVGKKEHLEYMKANHIGNFITAYLWRYPDPDIDWALDNGAFSCFNRGEDFCEYKFLMALDKININNEPDFIVIPDIVAGGYDSFDFSLSWIKRIRYHGDGNGISIPLYFAVQDGMLKEDVDGILKRQRFGIRVDGLFVGGSIPWKERTGEQWVDLAHKHKKKCHIGRVGTERRLLWAKRIGADSIDSTSFTRNDFRTTLEKLDAIKTQTTIGECFDGECKQDKYVCRGCALRSD